MKTLKEAVQEAVFEYLKYNCTIPKQFNLRKSNSKGWQAEFHHIKSCWNEGFTTWDSDKVLDIFFSQSDEYVCIDNWNSEWNDE